MNINEIFNKIENPKEYRQQGKRLYFDSYRKVLIPITPEEKVRQKTAIYLEKYLNIPHEYIFTEDHLHHYGSKNNGRIDIAINCYNENKVLVPLALVECKAEHIPLTAQVLDQTVGYANTICCDYIFITNGVEMYQYLYNESLNNYELLSEIVDYNGMTNHVGLPVKIKSKFKRLNVEQLFDDVEKVREYGYKYHFIGEDTPNELVPYIANMSDALVDRTHTLDYLSCKFFEVIEDLGVSYLAYGNASGSDFGTGEYRSILINDFSFGHRIINISILATGKTVNDAKYGNSDGKSVLTVSLRDEEKDSMVVQINLNKFLKLENGYLYLTHNGAVAQKGASTKVLRDMIYNEDNTMICNDKIFLGKFYGDDLLYMDTPEFAEVIKRVIIYSIIRDRYKSNLSSQTKVKITE